MAFPPYPIIIIHGLIEALKKDNATQHTLIPRQLLKQLNAHNCTQYQTSNISSVNFRSGSNPTLAPGDDSKRNPKSDGVREREGEEGRMERLNPKHLYHERV